jgi:transposase-like protein
MRSSGCVEKETTAMKKNRTKRTVAKAKFSSRRSAPTEGSRLSGVLLDTRRALRELVLMSGMRVFTEMLEEDRTALCGPRHHPSPDRRAYRHGHDEGRLVFGGRKVRLVKPRVRSVAGKEIELPIWSRMAAEDPLRDRVVEQILLGVSSRGYERSLEPLPEEVRSCGTRRSSVCRHFTARTKEKTRSFLSRSLEGIDLPVILIDGTGLGDHVLVVAMGIDTSGRKHILGVAVGTTESEQVCKSLFGSLIERGLVVERARLFVIDGGKGLRKAIRTTFGVWALVQRCQIHKLRNVADHLPKGRQVGIKAAMRQAWKLGTDAKARHRLEQLAAQLEDEHPDAARSIREGLDETLTVIRLGLGGWLLKTLRSTNPIENLQGTIKRITRNVKRWTGGSMAMRWGVTALLEAEKRFRRLKGHREMPQLIASLEAIVNKNVLDTKQEVA